MERLDFRLWDSLSYQGVDDENGNEILGKMRYIEDERIDYDGKMGILSRWVGDLGDIQRQNLSRCNDKLMQWTGLEDINWVKIYECDILKYYDKDKTLYLEVFYDTKRLRWGCYILKDGIIHSADDLYKYTTEGTELEVVGNKCEDLNTDSRIELYNTAVVKKLTADDNKGIIEIGDIGEVIDIRRGRYTVQFKKHKGKLHDGMGNSIYADCWNFQLDDLIKRGCV